MGNDTVDFQMAHDKGRAFFNYPPWADITLTAVDRFLKKLGYLEGEPALPAASGGEKLLRNLESGLSGCYLPPFEESACG